MSQPNLSQIEQLEVAFHELDTVLEKILHIQFGIEDTEWIDAIKTIEEGAGDIREVLRPSEAPPVTEPEVESPPPPTPETA